MKLYSYWRSTAAYRVRIACGLKGISTDIVPIHLVRGGGEQLQPTYKSINPNAVVPAFELDDGTVLTQSLAIIEYLDELYPAQFKGGEWHTWDDQELATFESHWAVGTRERRAHALHLYTGQRVSDVSRMDDKDVRADTIAVVLGKTGAKVWIPIHPDLLAVRKATPLTAGALVKTSAGAAFTKKGLANFMADAINATDHPDRCVRHG